MKYSTIELIRLKRAVILYITRIIGELIIYYSIIAIINNHKNYIIIIISLELILLSICYLFIYNSILYDDLGGIFSSIILLVVGAAETAVGLTIIMYIP